MEKIPQVEITSIYNFKRSWGIDIIPDPSIKNGYKEIKGDRIFISPMNYNDIKALPTAESMIIALEILEQADK